MTTEQILEKLHNICVTFPKIKFSDRDGRRNNATNECFAYSCVNGGRVFVSFRLSAKDIFNALFEFGVFSFKWKYRQGIWITIPIGETADWVKLHNWIAKSYQAVVGNPTAQQPFSAVLN